MQTSPGFFSFLSLLVASSLAGCDSSSVAEKVLLQGDTMGTYYRITVIDRGQEQALDQQSLRTVIGAELDAVVASFSTYEPDSEISKLNRLPAGECLASSEAFKAVFLHSQLINERSNGRFNPAIAPLVDLWGFGAERSAKVPGPSSIAEALALVDFSRVKLKDADSDNLLCKRDVVRLDFSAIAKGYAVDRLSEILAARGYTNFLVDIGGELRGAGRNAEDRAWQVAVEKPADNIAIEEGVALVLELKDMAIATSGNYRNYFYENEIRYGHTLDPQTGTPTSTRVLSATVLHPSAASADAWATALMASTFDGARRLIMENQLQAVLLVSGSLWETQQVLQQAYYQTGRLVEASDAYTIWHTNSLAESLQIFATVESSAALAR